MDYNHITQFLDKFKKILSMGEGDHVIIAEVISKHILFPVDASSISTKGSYIHVHGSPMLRNEIVMKKETILKELSLSLPSRHFTDIR